MRSQFILLFFILSAVSFAQNDNLNDSIQKAIQTEKGVLEIKTK